MPCVYEMNYSANISLLLIRLSNCYGYAPKDKRSRWPLAHMGERNKGSFFLNTVCTVNVRITAKNEKNGKNTVLLRISCRLPVLCALTRVLSDQARSQELQTGGAIQFCPSTFFSEVHSRESQTPPSYHSPQT